MNALPPARPRRRLPLLLPLAALVGCTKLGEVHASYPQVFSSQTLVRHRLEETQWLQKKLDEPYESSFRSLTDQRRRNQVILQAAVAAGEGVDTPELDDVAIAPSEASQGLPDPTAAAVTRAELDPIERLKDERAYRDTVRLMMRDQMLDDVHDADGKTLYQLNFDLTMVPAGDKELPAIAAFRATKTEQATFTEAELKQAHEHARDTLERQLLAQVPTVKSAILRLANSSAEEVGPRSPEDLRTLAEVKQAVAVLRTSPESMDAVSTFAEWPRNANGGVPAQDESTVDILVWAVLRNRIANSPPWFCLEQSMGQIRLRSRFDEFKSALNAAMTHELEAAAMGDGEPDIRVLLDSPTEYAQNHSEVSALSDVLQTSLQVAAAKGPVGGNARVQSLRETQTLLHSIRRSPLLLAYGRGRQDFGWVLGPSFEIDDYEPEFSHTNIHHAVSVQIVVPRFSAKVFVESGYAWIDGTTLRDADDEETAGSLDDIAGLPDMWADGCQCVELPVDIELQHFALHGPARQPAITAFQGALVEGRRDQHLLVQGRNLWRSPRVFVGGRPADRIEVLPDMSGIEATFSSFPPIAATDLEPDGLPLSVSTSHGTAIAHDLVPIHRTNDVPNFVTGIKTKHVIEKGALTLDYDPTTMPKQFHDLILTLRRDKKPGWVTIAGLPRIDPTNRTLTWDIPKLPSHAAWRSFDESMFEVGVLVQSSPFEDAKRVRDRSNAALARVAVFKDKKAAGAKPDAKVIKVVGTTPTKPLTLEMPELVATVLHPQLAAGKSRVKVVAKSDGNSTDVDVPWPAGRKLELTPTQLGTLVGRLADGKKVTLTVDYGSKSPLTVQGELTIDK